MKLMHGLRVEGRASRVSVLENVCGLITSHGGKDFDAVSNAIEECGYRAGAVVIDASLFVPQSRERVFIIAVDADAHIPAAVVADRPSALSIRQRWPPPAIASAIRSGGAYQSCRSETRRSLTSSKTSRQACAGMTAQRASACSKQRALPTRRRLRRRRLLDAWSRGQPFGVCAMSLASGRQ
jgi:site-specific DNA-cytosine methylase